MGKKPFGFDIFFGSFAAFLLIANGAEVTKSVVGEAKEMAKLAWNAVDDAAKLENSAKEILSEAKAVGKNSNTVVTEATALAEATEAIKNDLGKLIEYRTQLLNSFLEKNASN